MFSALFYYLVNTECAGAAFFEDKIMNTNVLVQNFDVDTDLT